MKLRVVLWISMRTAPGRRAFAARRSRAVGLVWRFRAAMRRPEKVASRLGRHGRTGL